MLVGVFNTLVFKCLYGKGFDQKDTIVICGSIRSGSTWLAELLSTADRHVQIFEPLHPDYVKQVTPIMPKRNWFVASEKQWPEGEKFYQKVLSGKLVNPWMLSQIPLKKLFTAQRLVIKFVRANMMFGWLTKLPNIRKPVLVMRHPCAIISSELAKGWGPTTTKVLGNAYFELIPEIKEKCKNLSKPEEIAAIGWCMRYHAPLHQANPDDYILVTYEALVRNGEHELSRIYEGWGTALDKSLVEKLDKPSDTSTGNSFIVQGKDPLAGWKSKLTEEQISNVLKVLDIFGMDFYSADLEPDLEKLSQFGKLKRD